MSLLTFLFQASRSEAFARDMGHIVGAIVGVVVALLFVKWLKGKSQE